MGKKIKFVMTLCFIFINLLVNFASSQEAAINNGIQYLISTQNPDGSFEGITTTKFHTTSTVVSALKYNDYTGQEYTNAQNWIKLQDVITTDYLSQKVFSLTDAGIDLSSDISFLLSYQNIDSGFGGYSNYQSTVLDTARVLKALTSTNYADKDKLNKIISYLIYKQSADGGFYYEGNLSNVYLTGETAFVFLPYRLTFNIETYLEKIKQYLINNQDTSGRIGTSLIETCLAYSVLARLGNVPANVLDNALQYILSNQLDNGSWDNDPYTTALCLMALQDSYPNLVITSSDISFSKDYPVEDETITISANIYNLGGSTANNVVVEFGIQDTPSPFPLPQLILTHKYE